MKSEVRMCPRCGSAGVDYGTLAGSSANCRGCHWQGALEDLLVVPFSHDFIADEAVALSMVNDMRQLLSGELGLPYLRFLVKWGFVKADMQNVAGTIDRKQFAAYLAAIAHGVLTSILQRRAVEAVPSEEQISGSAN